MADPCVLLVNCPHCDVDILLRRVVTIAYEAEPVPNNPMEVAITSAFAYWSCALTCTLEDVTALAEWMTAREWAPTGNAGEDLLSVCAGYSELCAREHCVNWMPLSAMGGWEDDLWALVNEDEEVDDG